MLFPDRSLALRLEYPLAESLVEYAEARRATAPDAGTDLLEVAGTRAGFFGAGSPVGQVRALGLTGPVTEGDIDLIEEFYRSHGTPGLIDLSPFAQPGLARMLALRGWAPEWHLNVLVRPVTPADAEPALPPAGLTVEAVPRESAAEWITTVARGFEGRDELSPNAREIPTPTAYRKSVVPVLARIDGEPAGAGAVSVSDGVAAFFSTSTRAGFRRRGVQTALLNARLAIAARAGCDLATVITSPGSDSQRNVMRAGFQVAYTKVVLKKDW